MATATSRSHRGFSDVFGSRLGRRLIGLLLGCALLPLLGFALVSITQVSSQLRDDAMSELHSSAKSAGMRIAESLLRLQGDFELARTWLVTSGSGALRTAPAPLVDRLLSQFRSVYSFVGQEPRDELGAPADHMAPLDAAEQAHLASDRTLIRVKARTSGELAVIFVHRLFPGRENSPLLFAELGSPEFFDAEALRASGAEAIILGPRQRVLLSTTPEHPDPAMLRRALEQQPASGTFEWQVGGVEHVARYWRVFLKPQFGSDWISVQSRPLASMLGPLRVFRRWFTLTAILALLIVLVASLVQIRRTLDPIADLHGATQRIAGGDLAARVAGGGKDEFGDLARSFNFMTEQLVGSMQRREQTERALLIARDEALAAARTEASFVANVSHELRTPLTSMLSCAEILRDYQDVDPQVRSEFVNGIADQARRLKDLVDKVLELSARSHWALVETDIAATLREAVARLAPEQQGRVQLEIAPGLPRVAGASDRLVQLWLHLLDNAIKFSAPRTPIEMRAAGHGEHCVVEITDHGTGMAPDDTKSIFEPFRQVGRDILTEKAVGLGLGLTLARNIVERHKGQIEVVTVLGGGSTFRVVLPTQVVAPAGNPVAD